MTVVILTSEFEIPKCLHFLGGGGEGVKANCKYLSDYLYIMGLILSVVSQIFLSISPYPPLVFSHNFPVLFSAPPLVSFSVPPPCVFFHLPPPPGEFLCPSHLCIFPVNKLLFAESVLANKLFQILNKIV